MQSLESNCLSVSILILSPAGRNDNKSIQRNSECIKGFTPRPVYLLIMSVFVSKLLLLVRVTRGGACYSGIHVCIRDFIILSLFNVTSIYYRVGQG